METDQLKIHKVQLSLKYARASWTDGTWQISPLKDVWNSSSRSCFCLCLLGKAAEKWTKHDVSQRQRELQNEICHQQLGMSVSSGFFPLIYFQLVSTLCSSSNQNNDKTQLIQKDNKEF